MLTRIFGLFVLCVVISFNVNAAANKSANKTILITGGLTGIGKEITLAFKNAGWNVWVTSRNPADYSSIPGVNVRKLDITNGAQIKQLVAEIKKTDQRLDVLVNNAGYGIIGPEEAVSAEQARDLLNVNVIGPLELTQASLPLMRANNSGYIINISSTSGIRALPGLGMYSASKMALEGLSEALAAELAQWNIHVVLIEPGSINNDWVKNAQLAANINNYPGYKKFTSNLQKTLSSKAAAGQDQQEIGQLALQIVNTKNPNLRYQTNSTVAALAKEVLTDTTGNAMRQKTIAFAEELNTL